MGSKIKYSEREREGDRKMMKNDACCPPLVGASILDGGCRRAGPGDEKKKKMTVGKRPPPSPLTNNKGATERETGQRAEGPHLA